MSKFATRNESSRVTDTDAQNTSKHKILSVKQLWQNRNNSPATIQKFKARRNRSTNAETNLFMKTKQLMKSYESVLTDKYATRNKKTTADASSNTPDVTRFL